MLAMKGGAGAGTGEAACGRTADDERARTLVVGREASCRPEAAKKPGARKGCGNCIGNISRGTHCGLGDTTLFLGLLEPPDDFLEGIVDTGICC